VILKRAGEKGECGPWLTRVLVLGLTRLRKELVGVPNPVTSSYPGVVARLSVWSIVRSR
jgi:hypothetical protein